MHTIEAATVKCSEPGFDLLSDTELPGAVVAATTHSYNKSSLIELNTEN